MASAAAYSPTKGSSSSSSSSAAFSLTGIPAVSANPATSLRSTLKQGEEEKAAISLKKTLIGKGGAASSLAAPKPVAKSKPPVAGAFAPRDAGKQTEFRRFYDRGDLPLQVAFDGAQRKYNGKSTLIN